MAKVNLSAVNRLGILGLMHIPEFRYRHDLFGGIVAARMLGANIMKDIDPDTITSKDKTTWKKSAGLLPVPTVRYDYMPSNARTANTTRVHNPAAGTLPTDGASFNIDYDGYLETNPKIMNAVDFIREEEAQEYIDAIRSPSLTLGGTAFGTKGALLSAIFNKINIPFGSYVNEMYEELVRGIFPALNTALLTKMVASVGKNAARPLAATPTAAAPFVQVTAFDGAGIAKKEPMELIRETKRINKMKGMPVLLGGEFWVKYLSNFEVLGAATSGLDYQKVVKFADFYFIYDDKIEGLAGVGAALLAEPKSFGFKEFVYAGTKYIPETAHANTYFGKMGISLQQFNEDNQLATTPDALTLAMDFRVNNTITAQAFPQSNIIGSMCFGTFSLPLGVRTTDAGDIQKDVTGIFGLKLI
jgi:hypothetical protein